MKSNKKIYIISSIILILLMILIIFLIKEKTEKVTTFTTAKIIDSYEEEITNYETNKMPFTIQKTNETQEIKINGKPYQEGTRIYRPGEYKIEIKEKNKKEKSTVKINKIEKSQEHKYNIYIATETIQALLSTLNIARDDQIKGFYWTARTSTVNLEKVKNNFSNLKISENNKILGKDEFAASVLPELREYVKEVLKNDENAYFTLNTEEDRFYVELELFGKIGLDDSRYEVNLYTDGTLGYVRQYEMTQKNKYERFKEEKSAYETIVNNIKSNTGNYNNHPGSYLVDSKSTVFNVNHNFDYMLISTLKSNITLWLQYPEMIEFQDENVKNEMAKSNIKKIVMHDEFEKLDDNGRKRFFENIDLNKNELDEKYFYNNDKKYLVITGTVPIYEKIGESKFKEIISKIKEDYGNEYTILYKPHPRAIPTQEQEEFFNSIDIKVLPGRLPMEAISFVYPNLKLGGFGSSLYLSVDKGKTLFFIANNKQELVSPLDELYDSLFSDAKFYN